MDITAASQATEFAFSIIVPVAVLLATWIAHRAIGAFEAKTKIDIPDKQEAKIDQWVFAGIQLAAEKSHQKVKEKTEKLKGPEKLEEAVGFVFSMAESRGWFDWTREKIEAKVVSAVGIKRQEDTLPSGDTPQ